MTLSTEILVFDVRQDVHYFMRTLKRLGDDWLGCSPRKALEEDRDGFLWLGNEIQGAPAYLEVVEAAEPMEWWWIQHDLSIMLDTPYGFSHAGFSCDDLHAWMISKYYFALKKLSLKGLWLNEYQGEWREMDDDYHLSEFGRFKIVDRYVESGGKW